MHDTEFDRDIVISLVVNIIEILVARYFFRCEKGDKSRTWIFKPRFTSVCLTC